VAIARTIYENPEAFVLDGATGVLDYKTEKEIMDEIYNNIGKNKTMLVVAHRHSTLAPCDKVYVVKDKNIELILNKN